MHLSLKRSLNINDMFLPSDTEEITITQINTMLAVVNPFNRMKFPAKRVTFQFIEIEDLVDFVCVC